ncbi:DUF5996 family protein [Streptomyces chlorus]
MRRIRSAATGGSCRPCRGYSCLSRPSSPTRQSGRLGQGCRSGLRPAAAHWSARNNSHLVVLRYDEVRTEADPRAAVLAFYESAYRAGARRAGWQIERMACPGGATDPHLRLPGPDPASG